MENRRSRWLKFENSSAQKSAPVGEKYQAQIPDLISDDDHFQLVQLATKERLDSEKDNDLPLIPNTWSTIEQESFLLGLYVFDRNLPLVNLFMRNKGIGDVLSFYYGKFYKIATHKEWKMSRKSNDQIVKPTGMKVFTAGWRQRELFARIFAKCTDECKTHLTRVFFPTIYI